MEELFQVLNLLSRYCGIYCVSTGKKGKSINKMANLIRQKLNTVQIKHKSIVSEIWFYFKYFNYLKVILTCNCIIVPYVQEKWVSVFCNNGRKSAFSSDYHILALLGGMLSVKENLMISIHLCFLFKLMQCWRKQST